MVVLGGVSAYVADILGYKIGKKRLSLWHIRPKYIARTAVVITGALIPLVVILLWLLISSSFRTWLSEGQQAIEKAKQAQSSLEKTMTDKANAENELNIKKKDYEIASNQLQKTSNTLKELKGTLQNLQNDIKKNKEQYEKTKQQFDVAKASLVTAQAKVQQTKGDLIKAQASLTKALTEVKKAQDDYKAAEGQKKEVQKDYNMLLSKNLELTNKNSQLETSNSDLQSSLRTLQDNISTLSKQIDGLKSDKVKAESDYAKARGDLEEAQSQLTAVRIAAREDLVQSEFRFRTSRVEFVIGEELARTIVPPALSPEGAQSLYRTMMRKVRAISTERGAKPSDKNDKIPFIGNSGFIITSQGVPLDEQAVENFWVNQLRGRKDYGVFIVKTSMNRLIGEPVILAADILNNPIVFRKGEIVAETKIDASGSDNQIRATIHEFLATFVNTRARVRRMIPVVSKDGESYGNFTEEQFFTIFERVKTITRQARLVAVAQSDTRAGDPLLIDLELH